MATVPNIFAPNTKAKSAELNANFAVLPGIIAAWGDYTPTWAQTGTITKTVNSARYCQIEKVVYAQILLTATGAGTGNSAVTLTLPVTAAISAGAVGSGFIYNADVTLVYPVTAVLQSTTVMNFIWGGGNGAAAGISPNFAIAASDQIYLFLMYEAA